MTESELQIIFGARKLKNWSLLEQTGSGIQVVSDGQSPNNLGDMSTVIRKNKSKAKSPSKSKLHTVGMDLGYGNGTSPGGYKYCLTLVDSYTKQTWTYGLKTKTARDIIDALWAFFVDAGGLPRRIQCDFDPSFVKGDVRKFLRSHKIRITGSPPGRKSQNGLVERYWRTGITMARAMLASAHLPCRFWFWAYREAVHRMNVLPGIFKDEAGNSTVTTPFERFYDQKPDYRAMLFQWGSIGYYCRPTETKSDDCSTFDMQTDIGIALGRSGNSNAMVFWNPTTQRMAVSPDYALDPQNDIGVQFPNILYDGACSFQVLRGGKKGGNSVKEAFPPGVHVVVTHDIASKDDAPHTTEEFPGIVESVPVGDVGNIHREVSRVRRAPQMRPRYTVWIRRTPRGLGPPQGQTR